MICVRSLSDDEFVKLDEGPRTAQEATCLIHVSLIVVFNV